MLTRSPDMPFIPLPRCNETASTPCGLLGRTLPILVAVREDLPTEIRKSLVCKLFTPAARGKQNRLVGRPRHVSRGRCRSRQICPDVLVERGCSDSRAFLRRRTAGIQHRRRFAGASPLNWPCAAGIRHRSRLAEASRLNRPCTTGIRHRSRLAEASRLNSHCREPRQQQQW